MELTRYGEVKHRKEVAQTVIGEVNECTQL